jgi:hypothetical protein
MGKNFFVVVCLISLVISTAFNFQVNIPEYLFYQQFLDFIEENNFWVLNKLLK